MANQIPRLDMYNVSPNVYRRHPVFVIDGIRYYMASKHLTLTAARKAGDHKPLIARFKKWFVVLYRIPTKKR